MYKLMASVVSVLLAESAFCAITTHLSLDCREVVRIATEMQTLVYDAAWYEGGTIAKIMANGQEIESGTVGTYAWRPTADGVSLLTLNVYNDFNEVVGTESVFCLSREDLMEVVIPEGTTEIGEYAFAGGRFTSVTIPSSVMNIAGNAFARCENIVEVAMGQGDCISCTPGFYEVEFTNMKSFDGSVSIVDNARAVTLSAEMMSADDTSEYTMYGYATSMYLEGGVTYYFSAQYDDKSSIKIDDTMVISPGNDCQRYTGSISFTVSGWHWLELRGWNCGGRGALNYGANEGFWWWTSKDSTKKAFADSGNGSLFCVVKSSTFKTIFPDLYDNIHSVVITDGVTTIVDNMFAGCAALETVTIPSSVTSIGECSFYGCKGLTNVTIPNSVTNIGVKAFDACSNLVEIHVDAGDIDRIRKLMRDSGVDISKLRFVDADGVMVEVFAIKDVEVAQRYPWNGLVDITVTLQGAADDVAAVDCLFIAMNSETKAEIPIKHITRNGDDVCSGTTWIRKFIWDAKADVGAVKIDDVALTVEVELPYVQLWENGPYWATCNVGASKPEEYGYYFWWGDTVGYKRNASNNGWISVKDLTSFSFSSGYCPTYGKNNSQLQSMGYIDSTGSLVAAHDAATAHLGAPWRIPTDEEFSALISNCDTEWTTRNGVKGRLVKGKGAYASKSIFLPAAGYGYDSNLYYIGASGYYWSSAPYSGDSNYAWYLSFHSSSFSQNYSNRNRGQSVRPVRKFADTAGATLTIAVLTKHFALDCREGVREISADGEELRYDASWYEGADSVRILENGNVIKTGIAGCYVWSPNSSTTLHIMKIEAIKDGQVISTETATFTLGYIRNVTARQLWPHKKVEVCYEVAEAIDEVADENAKLVLTCGEETVAPELTFTSDSSYPWTTDSGTRKGSEPSHKSGGYHVDNAKSTMCCTVSGATQVSFYWKVSCESGYDKLKFYVDGTEKTTAISGNVDWTFVTVALSSSSSHTLKWSYEKDGLANSGSDCGWVDCIEVQYANAATTAKTVIGDTRCTPGLHRVVWDMEADGVAINQSDAVFVVGYGEVGQGTSVVSAEGLVHRWSFNGNLTDSVGGQTATTVGNVTTDGAKYKTPGGSSGSAYIDLGDWILPVNNKPVTIEMWVTSHGSSGWQRIFEFGSMPAGYNFASGKTSCYTTDSISMCWNGSCTGGTSGTMGSYATSKEYHLAVVLENSSGGTWTATFYKQSAETGTTEEKFVTTLDSSHWPGMKQTEMLLGQALTCWDSVGNASYNELRIWNKAMTENELSASVLAGPDAMFTPQIEIIGEAKGVSKSTEINTSSSVKDGMVVSETMMLGYSPIDTGRVSLEINGREVLSTTEGGTFEWTPKLPGTYVLTHRAGKYVFTRRVLVPATDDAQELEIGWLDTPISNLFPNVYASVTNVVFAPSLKNLPKDVLDGCDKVALSQKDGYVIYNGWLLEYLGDAPAEVSIPEGVIGIASFAFANQKALEYVVFPSSLKHIGAEAFRQCTNLECVEFPEGLEFIGEGAFRDCTWIQEVQFPTSLEGIDDCAFANCTMLEGVKCFDGLQIVGECAFSNCWRMLSVELPASVNEIGAHAFYHCEGILGVTIPAHVDTMANLFPDVYRTIQAVAIAEGETEFVAGIFKNCQKLEGIELPNEIREIPDSAFEGCVELRPIQFPSELVRIGNRAFYGCSQINQLEFPTGLRKIGDDAFNGLPYIRDLKCPTTVQSIGARAFKGVWNDEEIKLPEGLLSLGADAFANCASIRKISLPAVTTPIKTAFPAAYSKIESVKILGQSKVIAPDFCRDVIQLVGVDIPASVTSIGNFAFAGLSNLTEINLPPNLRVIGESAFSGDSRLITVAIPQTVEMVGSQAFYGCSNVRVVSCSGELGVISTLFPSAYSQITSVTINKGTTQLVDDLLSGCAKLSEIDLPMGVTNIGARAFKNCSALTTFGVPGGVVFIGADAFSGCSGLVSISLPEGLESISSGTFRNCRAISSLVIPASVAYIGADAFNGCTALKSISYLGSCPEFDSGCYNGTSNDLSSYVVFGSLGWDGIPTSKALPQYWPTVNSKAITYWEPNTFEATFDGNGGTPSSSVVVQTTGMTYSLPEDDPVMLGAWFEGWWTQPVNGGQIKPTTKVTVVREQTFYAHWKYNGYVVRFDANGGLGEMAEQALTVNSAAELAANCFVRKNFKFVGWALSPDGEAEYADGAEVKNLAFEQDAVVMLYAVWEEQAWNAADYLNAPERTFVFAGNADWVADDEVSHDGIGSLRSGAIPVAEEGLRNVSILRTMVVGEGSGSFWWKVSCEPADGEDYYDYCSFAIDGVEIAKIADAPDWAKVDYEVSGSGEHTLEWTFVRDDWDEDESLYENAAWIDEFSWIPAPVTLSFAAGGAEGTVPASITKSAGCEVTLPLPSMLTKAGMEFVGWTDGATVFAAEEVYQFGSSDVELVAVWREKVWTLEEAANLTGMTLVTGGNANWMVDLTTSHDGVASIRSGTITDSQESWVLMKVVGPGTISFRTRVSGEYNRGKMCDYLMFEVDETQEFNSYDADWNKVEKDVVGMGVHTLKWTYLKNASKSVGDDGAWVDEIVWTPSSAPADPLPDIGENPSAAEVAAVVENAADAQVAANVDETNYNAFRTWAGTVRTQGGSVAGTQGVMAAPNAWQSFALGQDELLVTALTDEDLEVEEFGPSATAGSFDFTVSIKDVTIGDKASEDNLKKLLGLEGAESLDSATFSSENVALQFKEPQEGKLKFSAKPTIDNAKSFFMKVKVK